MAAATYHKYTKGISPPFMGGLCRWDRLGANHPLYAVRSDPAASPLMTCLAAVEAPCIEHAQRHELQNILVLGVLVTMCGADNRVAREGFGKAHQEWRGTFLALPHGIPSHDTLGRVWARLDVTPFERYFRDGV